MPHRHVTGLYKLRQSPCIRTHLPSDNKNSIDFFEHGQQGIVPALRRRAEDVRLHDPAGKHTVKTVQDLVEQLVFKGCLHDRDNPSLRGKSKEVDFIDTLDGLYGNETAGNAADPAESLHLTMIMQSDNEHVVAFTRFTDERL